MSIEEKVITFLPKKSLIDIITSIDDFSLGKNCKNKTKSAINAFYCIS